MEWGTGKHFGLATCDANLFCNRKGEFIFELGKHREILSEADAQKKWCEIFGYPKRYWKDTKESIEKWRKSHL